MSSLQTKPGHDERQLTMFALFNSAPTSVKKKPHTHAIPETRPIQTELIRLLRYGYSLSEISRRTNIPTSTVHLWSNKNPDLKIAKAFGQKHGVCLRIVEAMLNGARRWEELEQHAGLDDQKLGIALCTLFVERAITTKLFIRRNGKLCAASDADGHDVLEEIRMYFPGPKASVYHDPPAVNNYEM